MEITNEALAAVTAVTGEPLSKEDAEKILEAFKADSTDDLKMRLTIAFIGFEHSGGRDVELAEAIDTMGKAIRLREALNE